MCKELQAKVPIGLTTQSRRSRRVESIDSSGCSTITKILVYCTRGWFFLNWHMDQNCRVWGWQKGKWLWNEMLEKYGKYDYSSDWIRNVVIH